MNKASAVLQSVSSSRLTYSHCTRISVIDCEDIDRVGV